MTRPSQAPRRTEGKRVQGRSARVLESVLQAALEELGRVGYAALRIEDVAARSGVNKTTVYRRWPSKPELIAAVLEQVKEPVPDVDTGSLEGDVRAALYELRERLYEPSHRALVQVLLSERTHPEVVEIVRALRERNNAARQPMFERAIARGEVAPGTDIRALVEIMTSPLVTRVVHQGRDADDAFVELLAGVITAGAKAMR
ncbi:MAG TPA: TetR/AcrR family transcriptional regulator [Polyangiales bacterium]|nr:TetR/AcrR family transcriptional regulator [Polyangiales bacterium]